MTATALLVWAEVGHAPRTRVVSKTIAAASFVALSLTTGAWVAGPAGRWCVVALLLCMVGDLCLLSRAKTAFLSGLVAFLLGHVGYVFMFIALGVSWAAALAASVPLAFLAVLIWRWLGPHTGTLKNPVIAYIVVICTMVAMATGCAWRLGVPATGLLAGAVIFFVSDLCVARDRFVSPGPSNRVIGLPLYFGAQLLFAGSLSWVMP